MAKNRGKGQKREKSSRIIFYKTLTFEGKDQQGKTENVKVPMLKQYAVFNASQVDGYIDEQQITISETDNVQHLSLIEEFCKNTKADIKNTSNEAYYTPDEDYINMPDTSLFLDTEEYSATENYYATLLHELTHWTGHKKRLDRQDDPSKKYIQNYAYEELIAELGAAFLCAGHHIKQTQPIGHALYIKNWLKALKNDKILIFKASAQAEKAVQHLNNYQEGVQP